MWSSGGIGQSTLKTKKKKILQEQLDCVQPGLDRWRWTVCLSSCLSFYQAFQADGEMPTCRLLTQNQNPNPYTKPETPNLNPHGSAFFQHAETLNNLNKRNQSLLHPEASHAA